MNYHTIIVGAGPTGLACARELADAGKKVLLIEKKANPGPKVCAGGITWSGIKGDIPESLIERSFPIQHIRTPYQKVVIKSPFPLVSTINRDTLGKWMLEQATGSGAEILNAQVTELDTYSVTTDKGTFSYDFLVGADGSNSTVRRLMGIPTEKAGIGINYFVPGRFPDMAWHLDERLFGNGYAWIFPHGNTASIGAYVGRGKIPAGQLKKNLHQWCDIHGINLDGSKLTAALINYDHQGWDFGNRFLAGDAAGFASPLTGEGIYPGIVSGKEVAKTILDRNHNRNIMDKLIARHRTHLKMVELTATNRLFCRLAIEIAVLALRSGVIPFNKIEMTG